MSKTERDRVVLITGGAGFVGSNLAEKLLREGAAVRILDNCSRSGVLHNLQWLQQLDTPGTLEVIRGDVRDAALLRSAVEHTAEVYHLAAQVAVTTSVQDPETDFHTNATGTLNVLEAVRRQSVKPFLLYTSTNKVYGSLESVAVQRAATRYEAVDPAFNGVDEDEPLDFHSPYGCSKGAADQYVRDYARIYDLPTVVFRMSCIAGPRQFGNEDQGWVAHFLYSVLTGRPVTVYGDGLQVRDILHVHDLLDAMHLVRTNIRGTQGAVYNVGGGLTRTASVQEMLQSIGKRIGQAPRLRYAETRPGDQPLYISDTSRLHGDTGWRARRTLDDILHSIHTFWKANHEVVSGRLSSPEPLLVGSVA